MESMQVEKPTVVRLVGEGGQVFEVPLEAVVASVTIKNMLSDVSAQETSGGADSEPILLPEVADPVLDKVTQWLVYHWQHPEAKSLPACSVDGTKNAQNKGIPYEKRITDWDKAFCDVDQTLLFDIIIAANYLDIKDLLDVTCQVVANMIKGKTPDEIRATFNIKNDFTPEEEAEIVKENGWNIDL